MAHTQKLDLHQLPEETTNIQKSQYLAELWVLADKLLIPQLQNVAVREIYARKSLTHKVPLRLLRYVYENTLEESELRKLYLHMCASASKLANWCRLRPDYFPKEMLLELAIHFSAAVDEGLDKKAMKCNINMADYEVAES